MWLVALPNGRVVAPQRTPFSPGHHLQLQPHRVLRLHEVVHPVRKPPVVRAAPALLHAAAWATSPRAAEWRVAAAVQQRVVTPPQVREAQAVLQRLPRRSLVSTVLDDVELGAHARGELDFLAFLRLYGLPLPDRLQRPVRVATRLRYLDAWYDRQQVGLEVDGAHHRSAGEWEQDLLRNNSLAVAHRDDRLLLLRFTPGQLRHDALRVAALLRQALL